MNSPAMIEVIVPTLFEIVLTHRCVFERILRLVSVLFLIKNDSSKWNKSAFISAKYSITAASWHCASVEKG